MLQRNGHVESPGRSADLLAFMACSDLFDEMKNLDDLLSSESLNLTACRRLDIASSTLIVSAA